jgi:hypothetical protein
MMMQKQHVLSARKSLRLHNLVGMPPRKSKVKRTKAKHNKKRTVRRIRTREGKLPAEMNLSQTAEIVAIFLRTHCASIVVAMLEPVLKRAYVTDLRQNVWIASRFSPMIWSRLTFVSGWSPLPDPLLARLAAHGSDEIEPLWPWPMLA